MSNNFVMNKDIVDLLPCLCVGLRLINHDIHDVISTSAIPFELTMLNAMGWCMIDHVLHTPFIRNGLVFSN